MLARALPWWSLLIWPVGAAAILVGLALTGVDWPNDGMRVAIGAGSIGLLLLIILGVRLLVGMGKPTNPQGRKQLIGALAAILVFAALGGAGLFLQSPLRGWQDNSLEKSQQYDMAIAKFDYVLTNFPVVQNEVHHAQAEMRTLPLFVPRATMNYGIPT